MIRMKKKALLTLCALVALQPVAQGSEWPEKIGKVALGIAAVTATWIGSVYCSKPKETRRDWLPTDEIIKQINPTVFGPNFKWGVATSGLQVEGTSGPGNWRADSNISRWIAYTWNDPHAKKKWDLMGHASGFWQHYKEQIPMIKKHLGEGMKSFRLSIPMCKIQGQNSMSFDVPDFPGIPAVNYKANYIGVLQEGIDHYVDVVTEIQKNGLEPIVTFFHHEWSADFDDKGHFTKAENVDYYVAAYKPVIDALHKAGVRRWMPLNEPAGYAMGAYIDGRYPPGKKLDFKNGRAFTKNILDAHGKLYDYIHSKDNDDDISEVGIAHAFVPLDPYNRYNPLDVLLAKTFDYITNDITLEYLTTGKFKWPFAYEENPKIVGKIDFIGVNYYSHAVLGNFKSKARSGNGIMFSDTGKEVYAEGFARVIDKAHAYSQRPCFKNGPIPLYITENAVNADGEVRKAYIARHLLVLQEAIQDKKYDIRGYDWWSAMSPYYEWGQMGYSKYPHIRLDKNDKSKAVPGVINGSQPFVDIVAKWHDYKTFHDKNFSK